MILILAGFFLRLLLAPWGTLELDFNTWVGWSQRLGEGSFSQFYNTWSDYLPGYLYVLWFLGQIKNLLPFPDVFLYKLPSILADLASGFLIYRLAQKIVSPRQALLASALYIFNPAVLANSTFWGQADSFSIFLVLGAFYLSLKKSWWLSAMLMGYASLTKPQNLLFLPFVVFPDLKERKFLRLFSYLSGAFFVFILGFLPFRPEGNLLSFIYQRFLITLDQYPFSSVNAFNFWELLKGSWRADTVATFMITDQQWGLVIFLGLTFILLVNLWRNWGKNERKNLTRLFASLAVVAAAMFVFLTRVHERHLFSVFPFLVSLALLGRDYLAIYLLYSFTYGLNLLYSFIWINEDFRMIFSSAIIKLISFINVSLLVYLLLCFWRQKSFWPRLAGFSWPLRRLLVGKRTAPLKEIEFVVRYKRYLLLTLLVFSALTRFWNLNWPTNFYFDEVYHAFTAKEMLRGNPAAWEWWNTPPEGFAYEWTHPPLAKLGMVLGMKVFGENAFGWRFPGAILGVGSTLLVFLIGQRLFANASFAFLAAFLFSLDGLPLVMARIGMNDSYFLFFVLAATYFFLNERVIFSSFTLGLALASKWSAVWAVPVLLATHFLMGKRLKKNYLFFLVLPPLVYLFSYWPFFTSGHSWEQFIEVQKQMWWYHTNLEATHPFTSSWWSWPLMLRPVWLFVDYQKEAVANIYAMGNPLIWWGGLASLFLALYEVIRRKDRRLTLLILSYFIFFLPWALSPRIMFIYHYLPAIPFLCLILALGLAKVGLVKERGKWVALFLIFTILVFFFFYPRWTGIALSLRLADWYYWLPSWR